MRFFSILLIVPLFFYGQGQGQTPSDTTQYPDSLENRIANTTVDTTKARLLTELASYWIKKDSVKARGYAEQALSLPNTLYYTAKAHYVLGSINLKIQPGKAKKEFKKAIEILEKQSSKRDLALLGRTWHDYGVILQRAGDNKSFMKILLNHVIPLGQKSKDTNVVYQGYADVGMVFMNINNNKKAVYYTKKAIHLVQAARVPQKELGLLYTRLAKNYITEEKYTKAKNNLDKAGIQFQKTPLSREEVIYDMVLGGYYLRMEQWKKAYQTLDIGLEKAKKLHLPYLVSAILYQKFLAYKREKKYGQAKTVLFQLKKDSFVFSKGKNKRLILYNLAQLNAKMHRMKPAYKWLSKYIEVRDSLHKKQIESRVEGLEMKYQDEKKQRKILTLQNQNKQQDLQLQKKQFLSYALITGLIVLLLAGIIVYMLYRNKKRKTLQQEKKYHQHLEHLKQEHQLKVYDAMLEGQEQERQRIARDLHDGLGGSLVGVKLKLSDIVGKRTDKKSTLYTVMNQLDGSINELRRIAHNMMPETLLRYGLKTALEDLCDSLRTPTKDIDLQIIQLAIDLSKNVEIAVYRIVQELLTNAVKHAEASEILVQVSQDEGKIFITIEDDGCGFDTDLVKLGKGIGLTNIQNRIDYLQGKIDIDSQIGEGTVINVEVNAYE